MQAIRDAILELRIWWAKECALSADDFTYARSMWRRHARLIALRSPQQVARMERAKGLI